MRPNVRLLLLPLLLAPLAAAPVAHKSAPDAAARAAIEAVTARYRGLTGYRLEGVSSTEVTGPQGRNASSTDIRFWVRRPDRVSVLVRTPQMTTRLVATADSMWTVIPDLGQYMVQAMSFVRTNTDSAALASQMDPAGEYGRLLERATSVRALGRDTVRTARGPVVCERYALTTAVPQQAEGITVNPRVLWVDPKTRLVLLDSLSVEQKHPQLGTMHSVSITRLVVAEADPVFAPDAFVYRVEPGLRRVRRFMQGSPQHAAMEGQPAQDFALETLEGSKTVRLSELKGKVVVLDFWATWCGPCRGWLPIVAKARRELAGQGLVVYAVNEREPEAKVREYLTKQKLDVPVLMDLSGKVGTQYKADSIPLTVVVGRDGRVVRVLLGLHQEEDLREVLREAGID